MESANHLSKRKRSSMDDGLSTPPSEETILNASSNTPAKRQRRSEDLHFTPSPTSIPLAPNNLPTSATHVLTTQTAALAHVTDLYSTNTTARTNLTTAISTITHSQHLSGKLIVTGVGKSGYIAQKLVSTCKSLGVSASFMHACEAVHGDLGDVNAEKDVVMFVSFSGRSPELLNLEKHLPGGVRTIALSAQMKKEECALLVEREEGILLPAPIPEAEEVSFGVAAPTTSTTVALAVADMVALTVAEQMHGVESRREVFRRNHPGGAIGMRHEEVEELKKDGVAVSILELPSPSISAEDGE